MDNKVIEKATNELKNNRFAAALGLFNKIINDNPQNALAFQGASVALLNLQKFKDAAEMGNKALEINPKLVIPHTILAYVYDEFGNKEKSRDEAKIAMGIDPTSIDALCCFGIVLLLDNKISEAQEYLEKVVKIDPTNYLAQYNLAVTYEVGGDKKLFQQSIILLRLKPGIKNILKVIYLSTRLHRLLYLSVLLLSGLVGLFLGPEIVFIITFIIMFTYFITGFYVAFGIKGKGVQMKELITNIVLGCAIGIIGIVFYFGIRLILILIKG
jgi:Tfp pilus assembly protein PilF